MYYSNKIIKFEWGFLKICIKEEKSFPAENIYLISKTNIRKYHFFNQNIFEPL